MASTKISSADYTNAISTEFADTVQGKTSADLFSFSVDPAQAENTLEYMPNWTKWKGYYDKVPELKSVIDKKSLWTIGKGYEADEKTKARLDEITGFGKDSFNMILDNAIRTYTICGDSFCEIIGGKKFINLKPLDPGTIKIIGSEQGRLKGYEQWRWNKQLQKKELVASFGKKEIFHMPWNRIGDAIHGTGTIEKVEDIILMRNEAMADMKTVFHRYVKPLFIVSVDTDNETEIAAFKEKLRKTMEQSENLIVPKQTVDSIERASIPQYSTLDPLPWIQLLQTQFMLAEGVPEVILGGGRETTEATSKILYLAFQQMVEWNQLFVEECCKSQLGIKINLNFPASIAPDLIAGNEKAKKANNHEIRTDQNTGG